MNRSPLSLFLAALLAFCATGCLQIETHVKLHEDGSATITERVQFSKRLLEFHEKRQPDLNLASLLEKPAVLERMQHMGTGIELVSTAIRDGEKGARECVSVFKIPQIDNFIYVSPFFGKADYGKEKGMVCKVHPLYSDSWTGIRGGYMQARFQSAGKRAKEGAYKGISPADRQLYHRLKPMFEDMLRDFQLKFVFECYAPVIVHRAGQRDRGTRTQRAYLIDVSGENLDSRGTRFIANKEAMADLLLMWINGPHVKAGCGYGSTSQLFRFGSGGCGIMFRPSKHYFQKFFAGKTLQLDRIGKREATFEKDGYRPELSEQLHKESAGGKGRKDEKEKP